MSNYTKSTNFATKDALPSGDPLKIVKGTEIDTEFNNIATAVATKADTNSPTFTGTVTGTFSGNVSGTATNVTGVVAVANGGSGVTTSTGTGSVVLSNSPALVTPALGTPASGVLTNATGLPIIAGTTGTLSVARGGTGVTTSTGTGSVVLSASPTFTGTVVAPTPALSATGTTVATVAAIQALYPVGSIYINAGVTTNPATLLGFGTWAAFGAGRVMVGLNGSDALFDALEETGGSKDATVVSHTHAITDPGHFHAVAAGSASIVINQTSGGVYGVFSGTANTDTRTTGITVNSSGSSGTNANLQPYITVAMWKRTA